MKYSYFKIILLIFLMQCVTALKSQNDTEDPCDISLPTEVDKCASPNKSNYFGLLPANFSKNDIIYVYDFNNTSTNRVIYKLKKEKDEDVSFTITMFNSSTETLKSNNQIYFKLNNVNRFRLNVSVQDTLLEYDSQPSLLFRKLFLGDSTSILGDLINKFTSDPEAQENDELESIIESIRCFYLMYSVLKSQMMQVYNPCDTFPCCNNINSDKILNKLYNLNSDIDLITVHYSSEMIALERLKNERDNCEIRSSSIRKLKAEIDELLKISKKERSTDENKLLSEKRIQLNTLGKECTPEDIAKNKNSIQLREGEIAILNSIKEIKQQLPTEVELRLITGFLMNKVEHNNSLFEGPFQLNGNFIELTYRIHSIDSIYKYFGFPIVDLKKSYQIPILGKGFISFSSGSFISLGKYLQSKSFAWQEIPNTLNVVSEPKYRLVESGYTAPVMGFSALVNAEWKFTKSFGSGFSSGVGLTTEKTPRLCYLLGGSLFIGGLRQLSLTAGLAVMQVNSLSNNLQAVADEEIIYQNKSTIDYNKEIKTGPFLSLTYTPFALKTIK